MSTTDKRRITLRAPQERDAVVERWLRAEVVPIALAMHADPARGIPAEQVFADIRALHAQRLKRRAG